jgi:predicted phage tail protein
MGNIIQGSLKVHFISISDRYNTIEARFLDETDGYKMKTILVSTGEKYERKKTIDFFGITDRETVERECRFLLNWMQKVKRSIEFDVYLDALGIEPGDIFMFSHDIPQWLQSGRIVSQEGNILTLDREIDPATSYIKVRTKNDKIETFEVDHIEGRKIYLKDSSSIQQEGDTINITAQLFPEMEGCPYICGKTTEKPRLYRCIEITRTAENIRHIVAVEHIPELYD